MANIVFKAFLPGADLSSMDVFAGLFHFEIISRSSSRLSLGEDGYVVNFIGTGFSYQMSGPQIVAVPTGTVTQITVTLGTTTLLNWSGFSASANTLFTLAALGNWSRLDDLMFGGADQISMTDGLDRVKSGGGNDTVRLLDGDDWASGQAGADTLLGGAGRDTLLGDAGDDVLTGGMGADRLNGGAGADVFVFTRLGRSDADVVTDFNTNRDELHFDRDVFDAVRRDGALSAERFALGTSARDANDVFIYDRATGRLWYDADGSGGVSKTLVAELQDGAVLRASDIILI